MIFRSSALARCLLALSVVGVGVCAGGGQAALAAPAVERDHWVATRDGDRRVELSYVEAASEPHLLTFSCVKGEGRIVLTIDGLEGMRPHFTDVRVSLTSGSRAFVRSGLVSTDAATGRRLVTVTLGGDEEKLREVAAELLPILAVTNPGALIVADLRPRNVVFRGREKKGAGPSSLELFSKICFGKI